MEYLPGDEKRNYIGFWGGAGSDSGRRERSLHGSGEAARKKEEYDGRRKRGGTPCPSIPFGA
jgi:hypothetical protein